MKKLLFFIFWLSLTSSIFAQPKTAQSLDRKDFDKIKIAEDTLGVLGYMMVNDSLPEHRFGACKKFIPKLVQALKHKNSFDYPFERLHRISILYPADSTFRIFTWQLYVDKDTYHQYGAIQMNNSELKLFSLIDRPNESNNIENIQLQTNEWLGALYYNIHQFDTPEGRKYLLFGFDGKSFYSKRKVLDVLSFVDKKPVLGAPIFVKNIENEQPSVRSRIVLDYSAETTIRLNYDEHLKMIIFDHLLQQASPFPGEEFTWIPDGSYEGYELKNGKWEYVEKIFHHQYERGKYPIGKETSNEKKKDIFGNK